MQLTRHTATVQATRECFIEYIEVLKKALRDAAEASAAHTAGIVLVAPSSDPAAAKVPHKGDSASRAD